ncbi:hypothetical protein AMAG_12989 [Allomyces macrogynus ATCC 38327]|nr:hypothetical protein AMAG_12989 [Allomyces macrogynus ATCC 38327]|eukprot:KNE68329.1 hypothetical protein AMAG_12989 [Allomyces macrogynus ATCC 38327]
MGGGTVDLTAMRMSGTGFEELVPGLGASCGSTILDDAFLAMFRDAIGTNKYDEVIENSPQLKAKIRSSWERCKVAFCGTDDAFRYPITVPRALYKVCLHEDGEPVLGTGGATFEDGEFFVTYDTMHILYQDIVEQVHGLVLSMLAACQDQSIQIAHILCVGGFSQSKFLVNELRERLQSEEAKVGVSLNGPAAILLGAPIFACRPEILLNRVARITYGIETRGVYSEARHGPRHLLGDRLVKSGNDVERVKGAFKTVIHRGAVTVPGPISTTTFLPVKCSQDRVTFPVYVSTEEDPVFVDTGDCKRVGFFEVEVTPCTNLADCDKVDVTVEMRPSGFIFHALSKRTMKPVQCQIDFFD